MSRVVRALCTEASAPAMALAGVQVFEVDPSRSIDAQILELTEQPDLGVLLVEEGIHDRFSTEAARRLARRAVPMLVPFPAPSCAGQAAGDYVVELLRRAIGYRVRLR